MPYTTTHIAFAKKALNDKIIPPFKENEFMIGNAFPDIRYLGVIDRDKTHNPNITLNHVLKEKDPFFAGVAFHNLVDNAFKKFFYENKLSSNDSEMYAIAYLLAIKDYEFFSEQKKTIDYFDEILPQEKAFGIKEEKLKEWHKLVKQDLGTPPSLEKLKQITSLPLMSPDWYEPLAKAISQMENNVEIDNKLNQLCENYKEVLSKHKEVLSKHKEVLINYKL